MSSIPPSVFMVNLAQYVAGKATGVWVDPAAYDDADAFAADVREMLPGGDEWAVHDHQGFGPMRVDEYASFEWLYTIATAITEAHTPDAMAVYLSNHMSYEIPAIDNFDDAYRGQWDSGEDFAEEFTRETWGGDTPIDDLPFFQYVDWERVWRDMEQQFTFDRGYVFDDHV